MVLSITKNFQLKGIYNFKKTWRWNLWIMKWFISLVRVLVRKNASERKFYISIVVSRKAPSFRMYLNCLKVKFQLRVIWIKWIKWIFIEHNFSRIWSIKKKDFSGFFLFFRKCLKTDCPSKGYYVLYFIWMDKEKFWKISIGRKTKTGNFLNEKSTED